MCRQTVTEHALDGIAARKQLKIVVTTEHRQDYLKPTNHSIRMNSVDTESINFHHRVNAVHCPHISQCTVNLAGAIGIGVATTVPAQPDHQQGFPEMKFWMACHLGGALLSGVVVCMTDSSAPHSPY